MPTKKENGPLEPGPVIQADRDAARRFNKETRSWEAIVLADDRAARDTVELAEAFGQHRLTALSAQPAGDATDGEGVETPATYAYRYPHFGGGSVIRFNDGREVNGSKPIEAIPLFTHPPKPEATSQANEGEIERTGLCARCGGVVLSEDQIHQPTTMRQLEGEIERLRAALRPFAEHPDFHTSDDWPVTQLDTGDGDPEPGVTAGDFRRARQALSPSPDTEGEDHA